MKGIAYFFATSPKSLRFILDTLYIKSEASQSNISGTAGSDQVGLIAVGSF
jgi:hypothetical protein